MKSAKMVLKNTRGPESLPAFCRPSNVSHRHLKQQQHGKARQLQLFQFEFMMRFNLCRRQASIEMMKMENSKMISQGMDKEALFTYGCVPASDNSAPSHRIHRQGTAGLCFGWA